MNKKYLFLSVIIAAILAFAFLLQKTMYFVWANPYTETKGFDYAAMALKQVDNSLAATKMSLLLDGKHVRYIYKNPYGSGFLKNNPIPNDLDFAVGIDLGSYKYDGNNSTEIATDIVDNIIAFYLQFTESLYESNIRFYPTMSSFDVLDAFSKNKVKNISDIADNLQNVIHGKRYVKYTKITEFDGDNYDITMPYIMEPDAILLQQSKQIKIYTDNISYSKKMTKYLRELSIVPEFYVTITYDNKKYPFELVPEIFPGTRLQLVRRCFGSTVFNSFASLNFVRNVEWLKDDDKYLYTRLLSFRRHIGEIELLQSLNKSPVKILKRVMQSAEMVKPLLKDEDYSLIVDFVKTNFDNRDIQLLNEIQNIYSNLSEIINNSNLFNRLVRSNKLQAMYDLLVADNEELKQRGNVSSDSIKEIDHVNNFIKENILKAQSKKEINLTFMQVKSIEDKIDNIVIKEMYANLYKPDSIKTILDIYADVYNKAGFHKVKFVWLGVDKIGIVEDSFTKNIKDFDKFARENYLVEGLKYSIVSPQKLSKDHKNYISFIRWVQNDLTPEEQEGYAHMKKILLEDRRNFKPKSKWVVIK